MLISPVVVPLLYFMAYGRVVGLKGESCQEP